MALPPPRANVDQYRAGPARGLFMAATATNSWTPTRLAPLPGARACGEAGGVASAALAPRFSVRGIRMPGSANAQLGPSVTRPGSAATRRGVAAVPPGFGTVLAEESLGLCIGTRYEAHAAGLLVVVRIAGRC